MTFGASRSGGNAGSRPFGKLGAEASRLGAGNTVTGMTRRCASKSRVMGRDGETWIWTLIGRFAMATDRVKQAADLVIAEARERVASDPVHCKSYVGQMHAILMEIGLLLNVEFAAARRTGDSWAGRE